MTGGTEEKTTEFFFFFFNVGIIYPWLTKTLLQNGFYILEIRG